MTAILLHLLLKGVYKYKWCLKICKNKKGVKCVKLINIRIKDGQASKIFLKLARLFYNLLNSATKAHINKNVN